MGHSIFTDSDKLVYILCVSRFSLSYILEHFLKFMMDEEDNERAEWDWLKKK